MNIELSEVQHNILSTVVDDALFEIGIVYCALVGHKCIDVSEIIKELELIKTKLGDV